MRWRVAASAIVAVCACWWRARPPRRQAGPTSSSMPTARARPPGRPPCAPPAARSSTSTVPSAWRPCAPAAGFARRVERSGAIFGAAPNRSIGRGPAADRPKRDPAESNAGLRGRPSAGPGGRAARDAGRPAERLAVGHDDDGRDARRLLRDPAGLAMRSASGSSTPASRATTRTSRRTSTPPSAATSPPTTRSSTGRAPTTPTAPAATRRTSTRTATAPTSRAPSPPRSTASAWRASPRRRDRQPARRPGLGLLLPPALRRRADLRRGPRDRRREHVLLHRSVALQLRGEPGGQPGRSRPSSARSSRRRSARSTTRGHAA